MEGFIHEVLELQDSEVSYSAHAGAWSIHYQAYSARQNVKVTQEWGTSRMNAIELVQCALNVQVPTVRDRDPVTDRYFINRDETLAAREKLGLIKERFAQWAFDDTLRRERLCRIYNDLFNAIRPRCFDGSHLKLPGFSHCFELHPHQKDAIWRVVQTGNTGLFHVVGAGKPQYVWRQAWNCAVWGSSISPVMWCRTICWSSTPPSSCGCIRMRRC